MAYRRGPDDVLVPEIPDECPFVGGGDGPCVLRGVHDRPRKTGPCHPLRVMRCETHGRCFTLYPLGYAPYQRVGVEQRGPDGSLLVLDGDQQAAQVDFSATLFEAALDGAEARAWRRRPSQASCDRWWATQGRRLLRAGAMLGVGPDVSDSQRVRTAALLGVETLLLKESTARWQQGYRARGQAVTAVLCRMGRSVGRALRLLHAGFLAGHWGCPMFWHDGRRLVEILPFQPPGTAAPS